MCFFWRPQIARAAYEGFTRFCFCFGEMHFDFSSKNNRNAGNALFAQLLIHTWSLILKIKTPKWQERHLDHQIREIVVGQRFWLIHVWLTFFKIKLINCYHYSKPKLTTSRQWRCANFNAENVHFTDQSNDELLSLIQCMNAHKYAMTRKISVD